MATAATLAFHDAQTTGKLLLDFAAVRNGTNGSVATFTAPSGMTNVAQVSSAVSGISNAAIEMSALALSSNAATGLAEGPAGVRDVILAISRTEPVAVRAVSQLAELPVPIVTAICNELRKRGVVDRARPVQLTAAGRLSLTGHETPGAGQPDHPRRPRPVGAGQVPAQRSRLRRRAGRAAGADRRPGGKGR